MNEDPHSEEESVSGNNEMDVMLHDQEWWRHAFDAMLDPVAFLDVDGKVLHANRAMVEFLGIPLSEIRGEKCYRLFHQAITHIPGCPLVRATQTRRRETMDMPSGEKFFFVVTDPVLSASGELEGFIHVVRDVTDIKETQRKLIEQAGLLQIAARTARLGGWSVDVRTMKVHWSDEVARIHEVEPGFSPSVDEGIAFYAPECQERIREVFFLCYREGIPYDEELQIVTARGKRVWVRTCGMPVRDESGAIVGVHGSFQDISEWKKAEEERRQLQNQLLMAQKIESVGRLASGIAHDFNNLLSVVLGYVGFALDAVPQGHPLREDLLEIQKAADRAAHLTRQLLAFSRKQVFSLQVTDLNSVVRGLDNMLRRLLGEDIVISLDLHPEIGRVRVDPGQMEQVIMNLAVNARDAMPNGGQLLIQTRPALIDEPYADTRSTLPPGHYVVLSVTDTGCGMDPDVLDRIFDPFFTTKGKDKGTGLGLSIVQGIVTQSKGHIWVYSEKGRGTTFKLYFPVEEPETASLPDETPAEPARGRETVLLVEDEPAVRTLAARMLERAGYAVISAAGRDDALALADRFLPEIDLLVTDVVMPHMSGQELDQILRAKNPRLKTLFISGYPESLESLCRERHLAFLGKPFSFAELTRTVRELLDRK